jgi:hypothetical protein
MDISHEISFGMKRGLMFTDALPVLGIYQSDIETKPNIVIDKIIQQARKNKDVEYITLICTTIAAQERNAFCPEDQTIQQFVCQLLDDPVNLRTRQLIAVYFLRLLPEPGMEYTVFDTRDRKSAAS